MDFGLSQSATSLNAAAQAGMQKSASERTLTDAFGNEVKRYQGARRLVARVGARKPRTRDIYADLARCLRQANCSRRCRASGSRRSTTRRGATITAARILRARRRWGNRCARPPVFLAPSGSGSERARCSWGWGASVLASQVLAWPHTSSSGAMKFTVHPRFLAEKHRSPGPKFGSPSSIGKQPASGRPSLPAYGFGTSTRDGALKQYAVWSFR